MKVSDYIVEYLIRKGITDVFGYPGGMVTHLMDSFRKYENKISAHVNYHEQGAAFAACGYAQVSGKPGVAYATSGPGATNLITGICNAYFDSIPALFITGQVNTSECKNGLNVRQRGFQETDIVSMVNPVTKYAAYVENAMQIKYYLDTAFDKATEGRMGPVLLDIPMNIFRAEIDTQNLLGVKPRKINHVKLEQYVEIVEKELNNCNHPCLLIGNGVKLAGCQNEMKRIAHVLGLPTVTSMVAFDVFEDDSLSYGFIGAYGRRAANFIVAKSDLLISIGARLDVRQVGGRRADFAPDAKIIRFDVDDGELEYCIRSDELDICLNMDNTLSVLKAVKVGRDYSKWLSTCNYIRETLMDIDISKTGGIVEKLSDDIKADTVITTDVGQNQVWVAQHFRLKAGQKILFSGGHGAMGYSLPAAIGACYASGKKPIVCISGDGGLQMNLQELQFITRENLPIKIIVLNNGALGMIRHFQEMYFNGNFFQTKLEGGYSSPNFSKIAQAYGIKSIRISGDDLFKAKDMLCSDDAALIEIMIEENTYVFPKLEYGKPNQDQEPLLDRILYESIMSMD